MQESWGMMTAKEILVASLAGVIFSGFCVYLNNLSIITFLECWDSELLRYFGWAVQWAVQRQS